MPPFNAEVAIKAAEKRVDALERKFDEFEKLTRQIDIKTLGGMATSIADLTKRVTTLETLVKALGQASTASKGAGAMMSAEAMKKAGLMTGDEIGKLMKDAYDKQNAVIVKEAQTMNQKIVAQQQELAKAAQEAGKAAFLEARLKTLEAQVAAALAQKK
jgi:hypothetical protein